MNSMQYTYPQNEKSKQMKMPQKIEIVESTGTQLGSYVYKISVICKTHKPNSDLFTFDYHWIWNFSFEGFAVLLTLFAQCHSDECAEFNYYWKLNQSDAQKWNQIFFSLFNKYENVSYIAIDRIVFHSVCIQFENGRWKLKVFIR